MTFQLFSANLCQMLGVILCGRRNIEGWRVLTIAPRVVNDVSYKMWINHEIHFAWQAQHLVKFMCYLSWQAQPLVKFIRHFSWQAQHVSKFGMLAGAGNVLISNRSCSWRVRKVPSAARQVAVCVFRVGSWPDILGSFSDRSCIANNVSPVFSKFLSDIGWSFWCQRSIWWKWKVMPVVPRIVNDISYMRWINHEIHFAWQAQYWVRLEGIDCGSAHCK